MASEIKVIINAKGVITGGREVESGLINIRKQAAQTRNELQHALKVDVKAAVPQLESFSKGLTGISSGLGLVAKGGAAATILLGFGSAALYAADKSEELNNSLLGLKTVSKATGNDFEFVQKSAKDLSKDGLIPLADTSAALKNLLATGLDAPKSIKLLNALKDSAAFNRQGFLTMGEAVKGATEGIKNGNSILVDNAGITKNLSIFQKEYAASIGKTIGQLTEAEKIEAAYVGILKEAEKFQGDAARAVETYTGAKARLSVSIDRATAALGNFITQSDLVKSSIGAVADFIDNLSFSSLSAGDKVKILTEDLKNFRAGLSFDAPQRRQFLVDEIAHLKKIAELEKARGFQGEYEAKLIREKIQATKEIELAASRAATIEAKRLKDVSALKKQLIDAGKTELQALEDLRDRRLEIARTDSQARFLIEKDFQDKKSALEKKNLKETNKLTKDSVKDLIKFQKVAQKALTEGAEDPFSIVKGTAATRQLQGARQELINKKGDGESEELFKAIKNLDKLIAKSQANAAAGATVGLLGNVAAGEGGAKALVAGSAQIALDVIAPGLGTAAKPLLDAFSQGPEFVRKQVKEFARALPDVVAGFYEALPVFFLELSERLPTIIEKVAEKIPAIVKGLVDAAPKIALALSLYMPKVAIKFAQELVKNTPTIAKGIADAVYKAVKEALDKLTGGVTGDNKNSVGGKAKSFIQSGPTSDKGTNTALNVITLGGSGLLTSGVKGLGKALGFAQGGEIKSVRGGIPFRDSVPANLMEGEVVLDRRLSSNLKNFINGNGSNNTDKLLKEVINLLKQPMIVQAAATLNQKAFADIILNLNRTQQRIS
jgi:hypothetical protein